MVLALEESEVRAAHHAVLHVRVVHPADAVGAVQHEDPPHTRVQPRHVDGLALIYHVVALQSVLQPHLSPQNVHRALARAPLHHECAVSRVAPR